jgi:hypothetical protein
VALELLSSVRKTRKRLLIFERPSLFYYCSVGDEIKKSFSTLTPKAKETMLFVTTRPLQGGGRGWGKKEEASLLKFCQLSVKESFY